jgi:hypothetical protein
MVSTHFKTILLLVTVLAFTSRADFLSRELQAAGPSSQRCTEGSSVVCTQCGSPDFYSLSLGELKSFRPNLGDIESSLQGALQSSVIELAEMNGVSCIYISSPLPLSNGLSIISFINNYFQVNLAEQYVLPFANIEQYQLSSLSFNYSPSNNQYSLGSLRLWSGVVYTVSKSGSFQDLEFEYNGKDNEAVLSGTLKVTPYYRPLKFTAELQGKESDKWEISFETEHDNVGKFVGSFTSLSEQTDNSIVKKLLELFPSGFEAELQLKNNRVSIASPTLSVSQTSESIDVIPTILTITSIDSDFGFYSIEEQTPDVQFVQKCNFRIRKAKIF